MAKSPDLGKLDLRLWFWLPLLLISKWIARMPRAACFSKGQRLEIRRDRTIFGRWFSLKIVLDHGNDGEVPW